MKIQVTLIPDEGRQLDYTLEGDWYREYIQPGTGIDFQIGAVRVHADVHKVLETVTLDMSMETALSLDCGRCLEPFTLPVHSQFRYTLVAARGDESEEIDESDEDVSFGYYKDDLIDLNALVYEQIMLQVPIKPLCSELCRGLCPHCGTNLNAAPCDCKREEKESPFEALKNFKAKKQN